MPFKAGLKEPVTEGPIAPTPVEVAPPPRLTPEAKARASKVGRTTVREPRVKAVNDTRAATVVTRRDLEERLPRSAPDALRFEPGVYVQQTAHGQGSPYVRGLTGQQTIMMFDGIRLNNSTFRQGPNQYFFTIDSRTLQKLEVLRGASSTRYGADAMGGALLATPIEPTLEVGPRSWYGHSKAAMRTGTADGELGGRAQLDVGYKGKVGLFGGVGYRDVGLLRAGGKIFAAGDGSEVKVPLFAADGVTQRGTGFREFTADARLVWQVDDRRRLTLGYYDYRQRDAPRTDRCPPVTAPQGDCLIYDQQDRTLVYAALDARRGPAAAETVRWTVSFQNQHERRRHDPASRKYRGIGSDDVRTVGTGLRIDTREFRLARGVALKLSYGLDTYVDFIASEAWNVYLDVGMTSKYSRGQYLDGGKYMTSGIWSEGQLSLYDRLELRAGGRGALVVAKAAGDPKSESAAVDKLWGTGVAGGGLALRLVDGVRWLVNLDQGYRAPNMDDLTSRQQTGAGWQGENAALRPEKALSVETGFKVERPRLELQVFGFQSTIHGMIGRSPFDISDCPPGGGDTGCAASKTAFRLVNFAGPSVVRGIDGAVRLFLPAGFGVRATVAYAWGDGPNPIAGNTPVRMPLSRVPPLNGTAEVSWRHASGFYLAGALRWARAQTRLALADTADRRIPTGGTPGFAVADLRAGYRFQPHALVALVLENITNAAYRYHGSSINGPGRSLNILLEVGL
ncbi:TonB-dependent receptor [Nannocystis radixulma]|uniref:TonB-dependent receptor n=1 Tax=Nannocystis radixulma TaxID=2995305 RepID=A0ABT5BGV4_9BACT|nr:TonB-dependent receptor [Nannocystis radixulma]MDC0673317.1 TonB-dependent receptor [Nannocystis radixulma]